MYSIIVINQLLGWILINVFGFLIGSRGTIMVGVFLCSISFIFAAIAFLDVGLMGNTIVSSYWKFLAVNDLNIDFALLFDSVSVVMLVVVSFITLLVYCFSIDYMSGDRHISRFLSYLSLFSFFMLVLVTATNYLQMFIGWEGVGLVSYLLINFWSTRLAANKAAFKAIVFNRVGDYGLSLALCLMQVYFGSLNYSIINAVLPYLVTNNFTHLAFIGSLLFIAACGKSAQLGLHFWLPDAMEGPTRVSALIHAATMVTAGVYVIIRSSSLLEFVPSILTVIAIVGGITAIVAALIGMVQTDIKKVIAFSTCSQLGYMVLACGLSLYDLGLYHLVTHAIFKALLFLSAGSIIHSLNNEQNLLRYGALIKYLRFTYSSLLIASLALSGIPFLSGYYSKDTILEMLSSNLSRWVLSLWYLDTLAAIITRIYSTRLILLVFILKPKFNYVTAKKGIFESSNLVCFVFMPLLIFSITLGYLSQNVFIGLGGLYWKQVIWINFRFHHLNVDYHFNGLIIKLLPSILGVLGIGFSIFIMLLSIKNARIKFEPNIFRFLESRFFLDVFTVRIAWLFLVLSQKVTFIVIDKGLLDILGPTGLPAITSNLNLKFKHYNTGNVFQSIQLIVLCLVLSVMISIV